MAAAFFIAIFMTSESVKSSLMSAHLRLLGMALMWGVALWS